MGGVSASACFVELQPASHKTSTRHKQNTGTEPHLPVGHEATRNHKLKREAEIGRNAPRSHNQRADAQTDQKQSNRAEHHPMRMRPRLCSGSQFVDHGFLFETGACAVNGVMGNRHVRIRRAIDDAKNHGGEGTLWIPNSLS